MARLNHLLCPARLPASYVASWPPHCRALTLVSVWALVRLPVNYWILACFFGWGASCMICAAFTSFPGLLVFRFILGACEASISPSMLIIVSMWWTRREQPLRNK